MRRARRKQHRCQEVRAREGFMKEVEELLKLEMQVGAVQIPASRLCHFLFMWLWANYLTSLSLLFLLRKNESSSVITALQGCCENYHLEREWCSITPAQLVGGLSGSGTQVETHHSGAGLSLLFLPRFCEQRSSGGTAPYAPPQTIMPQLSREEVCWLERTVR